MQISEKHVDDAVQHLEEKLQTLSRKQSAGDNMPELDKVNLQQNLSNVSDKLESLKSNRQSHIKRITKKHVNDFKKSVFKQKGKK